MSPSQASETCASASSATSPWTFEYTNAIKECQDSGPSVFAPARAMTSCLLTRRYFLKKRRGSKATMRTAKPTPRAASVEATAARVAAIDEHVRPSAEPDPATTSLAESVCWHDPHDRDHRYNQ